MKHSLLLLVAAMGMLISCSKNKSDSPGSPGPSHPARIKTYTIGSNVTNYTYDSQGRLLSKLYPGGKKREYDYSIPNKIIERNYSENGTLEVSGEFDLNAAGLVIKKVYSDAPNNSYLIEYDADKNVIKEVHFVNGVTTVLDYFYTNGSLDSMQYKWDWNLSYTNIYTYYTDKANLLNSDTWGQGYEGYSGKYLLKKEETRYPDGSPSNIWENAYEFDAQGRVIKRIAQKGSDAEVSYYTYY